MRKFIYKRKIPLKICLWLVFTPLIIQAQSVKRQSISCVGATLLDEGSVVQQTVGQPYNTFAFYENEISVLQGFQQPSLFKVEKITPPEYRKNLKVNVYPNPASYVVTIQGEEIIKNVIVRVTDMEGRLIIARHVPEFQVYSLNCETWANGTYIITLNDENRNMTSLKLIINK